MANPKIQHGRNHSLETLNEFGSALGNTLKKDVAQGAMDDLFGQLLGIRKKGSESPAAQTKNPEQHLIEDIVTGKRNVIFNSADHKRANGEAKNTNAERGRKAESRIEAAIDHAGAIGNFEKRASQADTREIHGRLQEIMIELKRLVSTSKVLQNEFADVDVQQAPAQAGEYHVNFFDWLLITIRKARENVENSGAWLAAAKGKGGKKRWGSKERKAWFGDTSRSLNGEVSASNSTG